MIRPTKLTETEKQVLWSRIEKGIHSPSKAPSLSPVLHRFPLFSPRFRFALAGFLAVILIGSSAATVAAADRAKPGDTLFIIDLAAEKIQLFFTAEHKKDTLRLDFAKERLGEAKLALALFSDLATTDNTLGDEETTENNNNETGTTASSTDEQEDEEDDSEINTENIEQANTVLGTALVQLEQIKVDLEVSGNEVTAQAIDAVIADLTTLAENHVAQLDRVRIRIRGNNNGLRIALDASGSNIRAKFKIKKRGRIDIDIDFDEIFVDGFSGGFDDLDEVFDEHFEDLEDRFEDIEEHLEDREDELADRLEDIEDRLEDRKKKLSDRLEDLRDRLDEQRERIENRFEDIFSKKVKICHIPGGNPNKARTIRISKNAVDAHLAHGDTLGKCGDEDEDDEDDNDVQDTTAPDITNLAADSATTTALITWTTDEDADSIVWYGTTTPLSIGVDTLSEHSSSLITDHSITLENLSPDTLHYVIVTSTDGSGNTATSSEISFTTLAEEEPADTTAPVISSITATSTTDTGTIITWTTDEEASSIVWYGTTTPLNISSTTLMIQNASLVFTHELTLSGLTASTTHYFIVTSTDAALNTATSTENTFTTL